MHLSAQSDVTTMRLDDTSGYLATIVQLEKAALKTPAH